MLRCCAFAACVKTAYGELQSFWITPGNLLLQTIWVQKLASGCFFGVGVGMFVCERGREWEHKRTNEQTNKWASERVSEWASKCRQKLGVWYERHQHAEMGSTHLPGPEQKEQLLYANASGNIFLKLMRDDNLQLQISPLILTGDSPLWHWSKWLRLTRRERGKHAHNKGWVTGEAG